MEINNQEFKNRLKAVMSNQDYEQYLDMLTELFPEVMEEIMDDEFQENRSVGDVFVRVDKKTGQVVSMLMIVAIPIPDYKEHIKLLNLITGSFWKETIEKPSNVSFEVTKSEFTILTNGIGSELFKKIGKFGHSINSAYLKYNNSKTISLFNSETQ